jgi:GNAT superfamily N-acetyltransferase
MDTTPSLHIRSAMPADVSAIFELIQALAAYEKLTHLMSGTPEALQEHLFGSHVFAEAILAEWEGQTVGFGLFFPNYSTFLTKPGLYLEDLFVLPTYRRRGIGTAMLRYIAQLALERDAGRLEWRVLDWNAPAIAFYEKVGATILEEWRICRVTQEALSNLIAFTKS